MTTRTLTEIITKLETVIAALTPEASPTDKPFRLAEGGRLLRARVNDADVNDLFRRFDVLEDGDHDEFGIQYPSAGQVEVPLMVTLAYPAVPKSRGLAELRALEALIDNDRSQVRDAIVLSGIAGAGHIANFTRVRGLDRSDERIWFQGLAVVARFFIRQRS